MVIGDIIIPWDPGGGGGGNASIGGYFINPGTGNILIKDYCPLFDDCEVTQVPELMDESGDNHLELISYYDEDI